MFGTLNLQQIEEVLKKQVVGRLGCNYGGLVYVVPISYAYDGEYIYAHTREGMKMDIMRKNPDVCFQADIMDNMANWKSVIAWGTFEELEDGIERNHALQMLNDRILPLVTSQTVHLSPLWPFQPENNSSIEGIVFRIHVTKKTGRFENNSVAATSAF